jgi:hypothetical protein
MRLGEASKLKFDGRKEDWRGGFEYIECGCVIGPLMKKVSNKRVLIYCLCG